MTSDGAALEFAHVNKSRYTLSLSAIPKFDKPEINALAFGSSATSPSISLNLGQLSQQHPYEYIPT
jgi:hypothetical protein